MNKTSLRSPTPEAATSGVAGGRHKPLSTTASGAKPEANQVTLHFFAGAALASLLFGIGMESPVVVGVAFAALSTCAVLSSVPAHTPITPNPPTSTDTTALEAHYRAVGFLEAK